MQDVASRATPRIGQTLLQLRKERKLSVSALGLKAGVSAGMISQIERDLANPSLKTLDKLRVALDVPLSAFLEKPQSTLRTASSPATLPAASPAASGAWNDGGADIVNSEMQVIRRFADRPGFNVGTAPLHKALLSPAGAEDLRFMIIRMPGHSRTEEVVMGPGQKAGLVMAGRVTLIIGNEEYLLLAGDSFQFDGNQPHGVHNPAAQEASLLWIMSAVRPIHM